MYSETVGICVTGCGIGMSEGMTSPNAHLGWALLARVRAFSATTWIRTESDCSSRDAVNGLSAELTERLFCDLLNYYDCCISCAI